MKLRLAPRVAAGEQRSAPARILADARPVPVPKEARTGAAAWAPWAWRAQDADVLAGHARRAAADILPRVRLLGCRVWSGATMRMCWLCARCPAVSVQPRVCAL